MLARRDAVVRLWLDTHLGAAAIVCAVELAERAGGFPVTLVTLQAAAWVGYKAHTTCPSDKLSDFGEYVLHGMELQDGVRAVEMQLLTRVGFYIPTRTRVDCVYEIAGDLDDAELGKGIALALLRPELCDPMTDAQYARCVVFAAAYKAHKTVTGLATDEVPKEYIMLYGLRIARFVE